MTHEDLLSELIRKVGQERAMDEYGSFWNQWENPVVIAIELLREEQEEIIQKLNKCNCGDSK